MELAVLDPELAIQEQQLLHSRMVAPGGNNLVGDSVGILRRPLRIRGKLIALVQLKFGVNGFPQVVARQLMAQGAWLIDSIPPAHGASRGKTSPDQMPMQL
jgi:hypothetical protein